MDKKKFEQLLSEVADWHYPILNAVGEPITGKLLDRIKANPIPKPKFDPRDLDEMSEEQLRDLQRRIVAWQETQPNENAPPQIDRIKATPVACGGCSSTVEGGPHWERIRFVANDRFYWKTKCTTCKRYRNPWTGEFDIPFGPVAAQTFSTWALGRKTNSPYAKNKNSQDKSDK